MHFSIFDRVRLSSSNLTQGESWPKICHSYKALGAGSSESSLLWPERRRRPPRSFQECLTKLTGRDSLRAKEQANFDYCVHENLIILLLITKCVILEWSFLTIIIIIIAYIEQAIGLYEVNRGHQLILYTKGGHPFSLPVWHFFWMRKFDNLSVQIIQDHWRCFESFLIGLPQ